MKVHNTIGRKVVFSALAVTAIALFGSSPAIAKTIGRNASYVENVAVMRPDKAKVEIMKDGYVERKASLKPLVDAGHALKERMISRFSEGKFNPTEWLADVAHETGYVERDLAQGSGYADYIELTYLPALQEYLAKKVIMADVAKPAGWLIQDSQDLVGWSLRYIEKNGVTGADAAWATYVESIEKNGDRVTTDGKASLKEYFSWALYPFAISQSLQDAAYIERQK